ncbi:hypothetical protein AB0C59_18850 [Streptomyces sp. NPDC048664]|uniref:hypothetical protein n=1 Tax=Streptomyces sp. NPDC048664 TaxID=3154505 RepID=UPI0034347444
MLLPDAAARTEFLEVIRITSAMGDPFARSLAGEEAGLWVADEARQVLDRIAGLPDGGLQRCFVPGWGVRAHDDTDLLFEIAFCFRCHGARLWGPAVPAELAGIQAFDARTEAGRALLDLFRARAREESRQPSKGPA